MKNCMEVLCISRLSNNDDNFNIYLTAKETHIFQYPFNSRNPYQILP